MKIKGFLEDISGIKRITKARLDAIKNAPDGPIPEDPIRKIAEEWHPGELSLTVQSVRMSGKEARTYRFVKPEGGKLPLFLPGQYLVLTLDVDGKPVSRPYSISSAPSEAHLENGFVEITVKKPREDGFFADWIFQHLNAGDPVKALIGCGQFYYEPLRDAPRILALAGGIGITPFVSMAREIAAGKLDISMTILYGANREDELVLFDELTALEQEASGRLRVIPVLAEGEGGSLTGRTVEQGFLSADLIRKYLGIGAGDAPDTSVFICGPQAMYRALGAQLPALGLRRKYVRTEVFGQITDPWNEPDATVPDRDVYTVTVRRNGTEKKILCRADESLLSAMERAGIDAPSRCRSGECGFCHSRLVTGECFIPERCDRRREADAVYGYIHPCCAFPRSDLTLEINPV